MEIKKFNVGEVSYEFVCEGGYTRNGFYHRATLFKESNGNSYKLAENKVNYLNRTWESYRYQTAISGALYDYSNRRYNTLLNQFKNEKGYAKMTKKRYDEFHNSDLYKNDEVIKDCTVLKEMVHRG